MNKYRVEWRLDSENYFRKDCDETELESTKKLIKEIYYKEKELYNEGETFYRKFPVTKNKKIYF